MRTWFQAFVIVLGVVAIRFVDGREWSDASGKFRVQAELVAVRNGKVILEKQDGEIISVPLDKLSLKDQEFLKTRSEKKPPADSSDKDSAKTVTKGVTPPTEVSADGLALAKQTHKIFESACYRCHGSDGASEGGFNFVLNLEKVGRALTDPKQPTQSKLLKRLLATDDSVMPPAGEEPRPTPSNSRQSRRGLRRARRDCRRTIVATSSPTNKLSTTFWQISKSGRNARRSSRDISRSRIYTTPVFRRTNCRLTATLS